MSEKPKYPHNERHFFSDMTAYDWVVLDTILACIGGNWFLADVVAAKMNEPDVEKVFRSMCLLDGVGLVDFDNFTGLFYISHTGYSVATHQREKAQIELAAGARRH